MKDRQIKNKEKQNDYENNEVKELIDMVKELKLKIETIEKDMRQINKQTPCNLQTNTSEKNITSNTDNNSSEIIGILTNSDQIQAEITTDKNIEKWGEIKLMTRNIIEGYLPNGDTLTFIIDSGSSQTLISEEIVKQNELLSKLPHKPIQKLQMYVGNDNIICANRILSVSVKIQGFQFEIPFLIVPNLTKRLSIIGNDVLTKLQAIINIGNKTLEFKYNPVCLKSIDNCIIKPNTTCTIKIFKAADVNCPFSYELPYQSNGIFKDKVYNEQGTIYIKNDNHNNFEIKKGMIIAKTVENYVDLNFHTTADVIINNRNLSNNTIISNEFNEQKHISEDMQLEGEQELPMIDSIDEEDRIIPFENIPEFQNMPEFETVKDVELQAREKLGNIESQNTILTEEQKEFMTKLNEEQKSIYIDRIQKYKWLEFNDDRLYKSTDSIIDDRLKIENTLFNEDEQKKVINLVKKYKKAFSIFNEIGEFKQKVDIHFKPHEAFAKKGYPIAPKYRQAVHEEISRLIALGILKEAGDSVRNFSPAFPVVKKSTTESGKPKIRIVIDLRLLNFFTEIQPFPLLHFNELLKHMANEKPAFISVVDIEAAYHSLKTTEETGQYLGICLAERYYQLTAIPQGAKNSAAQFTRHLERVLNKHSKFKIQIFNYIDDIIIMSKTAAEHIESLEELFQVLQDHGVKLALDKCNFAVRECTILGHTFICNEKGIMLKPASKRIHAIDKIAIPQNIKQLRSFLGACNYLSRFVKDFRRQASILYQLTSSRQSFKFTEDHIKVFNRVKQMVKDAEAIYIPDPDAKLRLITDATPLGYGAVLQAVRKKEDGTEDIKTVGFESKSFLSLKFKSSLHFELFGLVSAIMAFRYYLQSEEFEVFTDSKSLSQIAQGKKSLLHSPILLRLYEKIMNFNFTITHVKANSRGDIIAADALSRVKWEDDESEPHIVQPIAFPSRYIQKLPIANEEIVLNTSNDNCYYNLRKEVRKPVRYGYNDESDSESETDEPETQKTNKIEELDREIGKEALESDNEVMVRSNDNNKAIEWADIDKQIDIPEYMRKPQRKLFESTKADEILIRFYPKQIHLNRFINDILACCNEFGTSPISKDELIAEQKGAIFYRDLYRYLKYNAYPSNRNLLRQVLTVAERTCLIENILCDIKVDQNQRILIRPIIVSDQMALKLINSLHSSKTMNHIAILSSYKILNAKYCIKNLMNLINIYVKGCIECNLSKEVSPQGSGFDYKMCLSGNYIMEKVHIDLKQLYKSREGYEYALIIVDSLSKFLFIKELKDRTAKGIIAALLQVFCQFGYPKIIVSDLESSVASIITQSVLKFLNIELKFVPSMAHSANAPAERAIGRWVQRLYFLLAQKQEYWVELAPLAALSANRLVHSHGYTPFYLMFAREPNVNETGPNIDISFKLPTDTREYLENLKQRFTEAHNIFKEDEIIQKTKQMAKHRQKITNIKGIDKFDLVFLSAPRKATYLDSPAIKIRFYNVGPLVVQKVLEQRIYKLITLNNEEIELKFHLNRLQPASLLVGNKLVDNLNTLISEIRTQGVKNKEKVIEKLIETQKSIIKANRSETDDNVAIIENEIICEKYNTEQECLITAEKDEEGVVGEIHKAKWKQGELYVLVNMTGQKLKNWHNIAEYPHEIREKLLNSKLRITGSIERYSKQLGLLKNKQ